MTEYQSGGSLDWQHPTAFRTARSTRTHHASRFAPHALRPRTSQQRRGRFRTPTDGLTDASKIIKPDREHNAVLILCPTVASSIQRFAPPAHTCSEASHSRNSRGNAVQSWLAGPQRPHLYLVMSAVIL
ncbi:hypothetical protein DVK06_14255 [Halorubrum sp. Atlit-28R]|nr:hypothetical protein DVK06_14255 [Halorubrum sp. Atlit-28R]